MRRGFGVLEPRSRNKQTIGMRDMYDLRDARGRYVKVLTSFTVAYTGKPR